MQHTVDTKRQFLQIQGNPFQPVYSSKKVKKILRESEPQFQEKLGKFRLRKKVFFL